MLLQPKDPVLLVVGSKDMDPHRIPGMGFDDRRHWIVRLVHLAGLEHMTQVTSLLFPGLVRLIPVIHSGEPRHVLQDRKSEEHTSELQSRTLISYAVFCLKKKKK